MYNEVERISISASKYTNTIYHRVMHEEAPGNHGWVKSIRLILSKIHIDTKKTTGFMCI